MYDAMRFFTFSPSPFIESRLLVVFFLTPIFGFLAIVSAQSDPSDALCRGPINAFENACNSVWSIPTGAEVVFRQVCTNNCCEWDCGQKECTNNCCDWDCGQRECTNKCCEWDCGQNECTNNCCTWTCQQCTNYPCCSIRGCRTCQACTDVPCTGCSKQQCGETCVNIPCSGCSRQQCGETCVNVPCTGCSKQQCGETCVNVPCTGCSKARCGEKCDSIPDSLKLAYSSFTLCQLARDSIPSVDVNAAIAQVADLCPCVDQVLIFIRDNMVEVAENAEPNESTTVALEAAGNLVDCLVDSADGVFDSEKDAILAETRAKDGIVLLAPEIGLSFYTPFTAAIVVCAASLGSKCDDILTLIENVFVDTVEAVGTELVSEFRDYYVGRVIDPFRQLFSSLFASFETLQEAPEALVEEVGLCAERLQGELRQDVLNLEIAFTDAVNELYRKAEETRLLGQDVLRIVSLVEGAIDTIEDAVNSLTRPLLQQVADFILEGQMPGIVTAVEFLSNNREINEIQSSTSNVLGYFSSLDECLDDWHASIAAVEDNITALLDVQDCNFGTTFSRVSGDLSSLDDALLLLLSEIQQTLKGPFGFELQAGVASYSTWCDVKIDNLPCSRWDRQTFTNPGCPGCNPVSADVPVITPCTWQQRIPLPKEHTPYLRLLFDVPTAVAPISPRPAWIPAPSVKNPALSSSPVKGASPGSPTQQAPNSGSTAASPESGPSSTDGPTDALNTNKPPGESPTVSTTTTGAPSGAVQRVFARVHWVFTSTALLFVVSLL